MDSKISEKISLNLPSQTQTEVKQKLRMRCRYIHNRRPITRTLNKNWVVASRQRCMPCCLINHDKASFMILNLVTVLYTQWLNNIWIGNISTSYIFVDILSKVFYPKSIYFKKILFRENSIFFFVTCCLMDMVSCVISLWAWFSVTSNDYSLKNFLILKTQKSQTSYHKSSFLH